MVHSQLRIPPTEQHSTPTIHFDHVHGSQIISLVIVSSLLVFFLSVLSLAPDGGLQAPEWNSEGSQSFREWYTELMAWLAVTGPKFPPQSQAGTTQ